MAENNDSSEKWKLGLQVLQTLLTMVTCIVAYYALNQNTESVRTASRGQLYTNDAQTIDNGVAWNLYFCPDSKTPAERCRKWLSLMTKDTDIQNITNADELYEKIADFDLSASKDAIENKQIQQMRRAVDYLTHVLDELHMAYDYWSNGVIEPEELDTWLGYIHEIGPHPIFLAVISHWRNEHYMSRGFAAMLQDELTRDGDDRGVIEYFYKDMRHENLSNFLYGLPEYGKAWSPEYDRYPPSFWRKMDLVLKKYSSLIFCVVVVFGFTAAILWIRTTVTEMRQGLKKHCEELSEKDREKLLLSIEQRIAELFANERQKPD